jgi:hypothetical protein
MSGPKRLSVRATVFFYRFKRSHMPRSRSRVRLQDGLKFGLNRLTREGLVMHGVTESSVKISQLLAEGSKSVYFRAAPMS